MGKKGRIEEVKALLAKFSELAITSLLRTLRGENSMDKGLAIQRIVAFLGDASVERLTTIRDELARQIDGMVGPERFLLIEAAV